MVDRYRVVRRIGGGSQGDVYEAYDPQLDRTVAVKVLRVAMEASGREGKALAKLSHPNIVPVFDHGSFGSPPASYVVMAYVRGLTLGAWLDTEPAREACLRMLLECARALQAAHDAGIVHGDVKPSNVLVSDDGVAQLIDFGVARAEGIVRVVEGTEGFLAPERRQGVVSVAGDEFSFSVLAQQVLTGTSVPRALARTLARGRRRDPAARHGTMAPLCAALEQAVGPPTQMAWTVVTLAVVSVASLVGVSRLDGAASACAVPEMASVWWPARRAALMTRAPEGAAMVDRAVEGWIPAVQRACDTGDATQQSCLADWLAELDAHVRGLEGQSPERTLTELAGMEAPSTCAAYRVGDAPESVAAAARAYAEGDWRLAQERVDAAMPELASLPPGSAARLLRLRARLLVDELDEPQAARRGFEDALWRATAADLPSLECRLALDLVGHEVAWSKDLTRAERWLRRAESAAQRSGLAADADAVLNARSLLANTRGDYDDAIAYATQLRTRSTASVRAQGLLRGCASHELAGRPEDAVPWCTDAMDAYDALFGPRHPTSLDVRLSLGAALEGAGRYAEASVVLEELWRVTEETGAKGMRRIRVLNSLAIVREQLDRFDAAAQAYETALDELETMQTPPPALEEVLHHNLATLLLQIDRAEEAEVIFERVRVAMEARLGADAPRLTTVYWGLGHAYLEQARYAESVAALNTALARAEGLGGGPVMEAKLRSMLAKAQVHGALDLAAGRQNARTAIALLAEHAPDHVEVIAETRRLLEEAADMTNEQNGPRGRGADTPSTTRAPEVRVP